MSRSLLHRARDECAMAIHASSLHSSLVPLIMPTTRAALPNNSATRARALLLYKLVRCFVHAFVEVLRARARESARFLDNLWDELYGYVWLVLEVGSRGRLSIFYENLVRHTLRLWFIINEIYAGRMCLTDCYTSELFL